MMIIKSKSFTLLEILIVLVIIAVLATLGLPNYANMKEQALNKEAWANLKLIQAAEKIYKMETGDYYYPSSQETTQELNTYLKLSLPAGTSRHWDYGFTNMSGGMATAKRVGIGADSRAWCLEITSEEDPYSCGGIPIIPTPG